MSTSRGFWDAFGAASQVDWCEPNYAATPWVAELWNTLSSLPIFAIGLYGLVRWWARRDVLEPRFGACFAALAVIGLGSTAFHATLLRLPQAADELPMVWLSVLCLYCLVARGADVSAEARRRWAAALGAYTATFTLAYFAVEAYFALFIASYAGAVAYVCVVTWRVAFRESGSTLTRRMFWWSVGAYIGGFALFWLPERMLGCAHPFQAIQPHALFHLGGAVGPYAWILLAAVDRLERLGRTPGLVFEPLPFVAGRVSRPPAR